MIAELVTTQLGGDRARFEALDAESRADMLGWAIARRLEAGAEQSITGATPRDLVRHHNAMHGKGKKKSKDLDLDAAR